MLVKDVMSSKAETINPDFTLKRAASIMKKSDIGFLPVGENDRLVGMVTDRDIAIRGVAEGLDPNTTKVRDILTKEVIYCYEDQNLEEAANIMQDKKIRRLPVLNRNKRLVGVLALGDFTLTKDPQLSGEIMESVAAHH